MADQYYSFERALRELKLKSEELKRLVSEGEIHAVRERDTIKVSKADVDRLMKKGGELEFADEGTAEEAGMATAELAEDDTLLAEDEPVEELAVSETTVTVAKTPRPTVQKAPPRRVAPPPPVEKGSTLVLVCSILTGLMLFYGLFVAQSIASETSTGLTDWLANMFAKK